MICTQKILSQLPVSQSTESTSTIKPNSLIVAQFQNPTWASPLNNHGTNQPRSRI